MGKLLRHRDILLLGLAGVLNVFEEIRDPLHVMSKGYESMYGWVPHQFRRNNFYHLVWRSIKTGYVEKVEKNGEMYLRLTSQGDEKVKRDFPLIALQRKPWDRKWRVVMFDIAEKEKRLRDDFRSKLKELGFGMLQESVFITPHDVLSDFVEFVDAQELSDSVYVMEVSEIRGGDVRTLANKLWDLEQLNEQYRRILEKIEEYLKILSGRGEKLNTNETGELRSKGKTKEEIVREIRKDYLQVVSQDPFLPKELLPHGWKGLLVKEYIKKLRE